MYFVEGSLNRLLYIVHLPCKDEILQFKNLMSLKIFAYCIMQIIRSGKVPWLHITNRKAFAIVWTVQFLALTYS